MLDYRDIEGDRRVCTNLILNVMVIVMFILIHLYRDRCLNPEKSVFRIITAVYIGLAVRECVWAYIALEGYREIYSGLKTVHDLVMSC